MDIGRLATLYTQMLQHNKDSVAEARTKLQEGAKDGKIDQSAMDKLEMLQIQEDFAAENLFITTVSNMQKKDDETKGTMARNIGS